MSRACVTRRMITTKREAAFWSLVNKGGDDDCWCWQGRKSKGGYGQFSVGGRAHGIEGTHRISWVLCVGEIPDGACVLHNCPGGDNPACVNPRHLFLGTPKDNAQDASRKGQLATGDQHWSRRTPHRVARGNRSGKRKLTEAEATEIRSAYEAGGVSMRALGRRYGVVMGTVHAIINRKTWRHLP